ncbi:MAG: CoA-binding protein [Deltaproteobacteria bacterium]|nr:CoA-binding protein [Deltaproteobacteria bacterium]
MEKKRASLDEIFSPRGIAVVGASPSRGPFVQGLQEAEFPAIYPVNPKYRELFGLRCYPNLQSIPGIVDHVVVSIPAEAAPALMDDCLAKGIKSIHFFTAGFSETGYQGGVELERTILDKARASGIRIIGPNCMGMFVPKSRVTSTIFGKPLQRGPVAFLSQSGGNCADLPFFTRPRGVHFSKLISYGNAIDINENELLEYFAQDPETEIIAAYIEGVRNGTRFVSILKEAASRKPVVIYKGGTTGAGQRAAFGHTASMTSSIAVFDAVCRQSNSIRVDDMEELTDMLVALRMATPIPQGPGVAVLGTGGGGTVLAGDVMEKAGLHLPPLSAEIREDLKEYLPLAGSIFGNPMDSTSLMSREGISAVLRRLGELPDIHMFVYHLGYHPVSHWGSSRLRSFVPQAIEGLLEAQRATGKPVLLALRPSPDLPGMKDFFAAQEAFVEAGFPVFHSLIKLAKALARLVAWNQAR